MHGTMSNYRYIIDYLKGNRRGRRANRVEREAMRNHFLSEALEGYDKHEGEHAEDILRLQHEVALSAQRHRNTLWWAAAACVITLLGLSTFFFLRPTGEKLFPTPIIAESVDSTMKIVDTVQTPTLLAVTEERKPVQQQKQPPKAEVATRTQVAPLPTLVDEILAEVEVEATLTTEPSAATVADKIAAHSEAAKEDAIILNEVVITAYTTKNRQSISASASVVRISYPSAKPKKGNAAYLKYIEKNLRYPADSTCGSELTGRVILKFSVDKSGYPYDIEVVQSLCESYDNEAIRLIKEGGKWQRSTESVEYSIEFKDRQ
ncbi:MAG: energy transducer TonB [Bacteroidales bacterium]|nr:energy transducer TonB [Bacteroidales bacterium]